MDAKITKKRLVGMLSYDWIKILAIALGGIFFWSLVFTTTATRITPAQQFYIFNYNSNKLLSEKFHSHLNNAFDKGVFSYEVLETNVGDLVTAAEYTATVLDARMSVSEGDILFVPNVPDKNYATTNPETGETKYEYTYVESFVCTYFSVLYELDGDNGYFTKMENFLNEYYGGDHKTGVLNEEKAKQDFRARISKNKDKRFKKQAEITAGEQAEIERIKKYKTAFDEFNAYLGAGVVSFTKVEREIGNDIQVSGNYALNICPDENKNPKLKDYVSYVTEKVNADGVKLNVATAQDMHVTFFRFRDVEDSFEFEAVLYLNDLIKTCLAGASVA